MDSANGDVIAIAEMNALQASVLLAERKDGVVRKIGEAHETDAAQLGERSELEDGEVCEQRAIGEVDVADAWACLHKPRHAPVGDAGGGSEAFQHKRPGIKV